MCLVPDFRILGEQMLRQWFQKLPIQALSATCPPAVQDDIIKILRLKPMVDGTAARPNRTSESITPSCVVALCPYEPMLPARDVRHWSTARNHSDHGVGDDTWMGIER